MRTFPTTGGAFDVTHNGFDDVFVTRLNAAGSALTYSTFLGGAAFDAAVDIAVDKRWRAYVAGQTASAGPGATAFPTTPGAFDVTHNGGSDPFTPTDAFVTRLDLGPGAPGQERGNP